MKRLMTAAAVAVLLAFCGCDPEEDPKHYGTYNGVVYAKDGDVVPGEWTCQYTKARACAVRHRRPFVFFWGNDGCGVCASAERSIAGADFVTWMRKSGYVFAFGVRGAVGGAEADRMYSALGSVPKYPGVGFYWPKGGSDTAAYDAKTYGPMTAADIMAEASRVFK